MISAEQLNAVAQRIAEAYLDDALVSQLRTEFSPLHFTYCMDDDVCGFSPVIENPKFNLYLIDGREHCLTMTNNHDVATGIVVAEVIADE